MKQQTGPMTLTSSRVLDGFKCPCGNWDCDGDVKFIQESTMKVKDLATLFGVTRQTITKWRKHHVQTD